MKTIEELAEEDKELDKLLDLLEYHGLKYEVTLPYGYIFKDENGNVINATKIVLEKKKRIYPRSLAECLRVLGYTENALLGNQKNLYSYNVNLLIDFQKLLICRDAYWKIAGEEMGLEKPWEPDFTNFNEERFGIYAQGDKIVLEAYGGGDVNVILTFPTEEIRDAFYENFKVLIESCKELL